MVKLSFILDLEIPYYHKNSQKHINPLIMDDYVIEVGYSGASNLKYRYKPIAISATSFIDS